MTSYLNNGYDVMNYFAKFEKFIPYSIIIPSFMTIGSQMSELHMSLSKSCIRTLCFFSSSVISSIGSFGLRMSLWKYESGMVVFLHNQIH